MYLTYDEYVALGGTLDDITFNQLEYDAETYINYYTFSRLKQFEEIPYEVKRCVFSLIQYVNNLNKSVTVESDDSRIASQSNDGVSVSYNVMGASEVMTSSKREIDTTIKRYLDDVKDSKGRRILYRGVY